MTEEPAIMEGWTIYDHPKDYPDKYVARRWTASRFGDVIQTDDILCHPDLDTVRGLVGRVGGMHLVRVPRMKNDDPVIIEVWL